MQHLKPLAAAAAPRLSPAGPTPARAGQRLRRLVLPGLLALLALATTAQAQNLTSSFAYTGGVQTYSVPAGVTAVQVVATGASGGSYSGYTNYSAGAQVQATVAVTPGEVLTVVVGGQGSSGQSGTGAVAGGYNGGGMGYSSGGGGGASDVRRASVTGSTGDYLTTRNALLVAGGGGGSHTDPATGGSGGTPSGGDGTLSNSQYGGSQGSGASQSAPGSGGNFNGQQGRPGSTSTGGAGNTGYYGSGGGGGYYGGGGSAGPAGGGGGASDVRRASAAGSTSDYLTTRNALLVAGGGGGSDLAPGTGGSGGTPTGGDGSVFASAYGPSQGIGASQSGPGSGGNSRGDEGNPGSNGTGGAAGTVYFSCGGGGGYYGGGGSAVTGGGGGGSSWATAAATDVSYRVASATGSGAVSISPLPPPNLVVSTPGQTIGAGTYNNITVLSGGVGTLAASTNVFGSVTVQSGGVLNDGCFVLSGSGTFTLAAGGTLGICAAQGISSSGSTGAVQVTGPRSFSTDALYNYNNPSASQATGTGLPATVRTLTLNKAGSLTLTAPVTVTGAATLIYGVLLTGSNALTLGSGAGLSETVPAYVMGTVQTTRTLSTAGTSERFGGMGLTLTPSGPTLPGATLVVRTTGTARPGAGTSQSVKRVFDIQPTVKTGLNVALTLTVREDELNNIAPANLRLFKSDNAGSTWQPQAAATFSSTAQIGFQSATYTASLGGISNFSLWTLGNAANPLPVELSGFTATAAGPAAVRLAWTTAMEKNSATFDVERSPDGKRFAAIGTVAAGGSSSTPRSYELLDAQLPVGASMLYYRLKQVDQDGTFSYSPVRTVQLTGAAAGLALYPNPTQGGAATLTGAQPGTAVIVFDALGRPVTTTTADASGTAVLALPAGLPAGVYVVRAGARAVRLTVE